MSTTARGVDERGAGSRLVPVVVVHGGAGDVPADRQPWHVEGVKRAATVGSAVLEAGGSALDAVQRAVETLEDDPLFNAGTGACLTEAGTIELDACIMEGTALRAGAVTVLPPFLHPVAVARAVLEEGRHVLYAGEGAAAFARAHGFSPATLERMRTPQAEERLRLTLAGRAGPGWAGGTVGAVAIDARGHVAAATSTGGTVGKRPGRVGDTPLVGCGTYADDDAGACSATGIGETIMRATLARAAVDLLRAGVPAAEAARAAIATFERRVGGSGGIILVGRDGSVGVAHNTETMTFAIARVGEAVTGGC
jgi:beta-aspartyl-peptidase (threonine type)